METSVAAVFPFPFYQMTPSILAITIQIISCAYLYYLRQYIYMQYSEVDEKIKISFLSSKATFSISVDTLL